MPDWIWFLVGFWAVIWLWSAWYWWKEARGWQLACRYLQDVLVEDRCPFVNGKLPQKLPEVEPFKAKVVCRGEKVGGRSDDGR